MMIMLMAKTCNSRKGNKIKNKNSSPYNQLQNYPLKVKLLSVYCPFITFSCVWVCVCVDHSLLFYTDSIIHIHFSLNTYLRSFFIRIRRSLLSY